MRLRRSTGAVLLAALPLIVGGCGLGGGGGTPATVPTNTVNQSLLPHLKRHSHRHSAHHPRPRPAPPGVAALVRRAVTVSQAEPGLRVIATLTTRGPGVSVNGRSSMAASDAIGPGAVSAQLTVPLNRPKGGQRTYPVRVIVRSGVMYLQPPPPFAGLVSPRRRWWAVPLDRLSAYESSPKIGQLVRAAAAINDPAAYLSLLGKFASTMNELGRATVDGIHTTHYKALVTLAQAVDAVSPALSGILGPPLRAAAAVHSSGLLAVDVWIDPSHLIRRLHLSMSAAGQGGGPIELSLQQDYVSYLGVAAPAAPPPSHAARPNP
ncbi:MAG TPA: hypothetical protein VG321_01975 [Solirubrobacteraceae bacterium]|nr:hypothetical protein [Solirubrobacteraceae bacterium]